MQTLVPAWVGRRLTQGVRWVRSRWDTPDGDFIDVDALAGPDRPHSAPLLVLFHGLEGSSASHYALTFAAQAQARGWHLLVPHFRGCSGEINRAPRAYHSGDALEVAWMLQRARAMWPQSGAVWAVGISLGGNALLRWAEEAGSQALQQVDAVASVCAPLDLLAAGRAIDRGLNRWLYARLFLKTMKDKARQKWAQYPGLFDLERALRAPTLEAFDDAFTAPLHGYRGVLDYWTRASARPYLAAIRVPALVLNARNDPFVPESSLPQAHEGGTSVCLWQPPYGGHVGFAHRSPAAGGTAWMALDGMPRAVCDWLQGATGGGDRG
jgi:uncharacterized protein